MSRLALALTNFSAESTVKGVITHVVAHEGYVKRSVSKLVGLVDKNFILSKQKIQRFHILCSILTKMYAIAW